MDLRPLISIFWWIQVTDNSIFPKSLRWSLSPNYVCFVDVNFRSKLSLCEKSLQLVVLLISRSAGGALHFVALNSADFTKSVCSVIPMAKKNTYRFYYLFAYILNIEFLLHIYPWKKSYQNIILLRVRISLFSSYLTIRMRIKQNLRIFI